MFCSNFLIVISAAVSFATGMHFPLIVNCDKSGRSTQKIFLDMPDHAKVKLFEKLGCHYPPGVRIVVAPPDEVNTYRGRKVDPSVKTLCPLI